MNQKDYALLAAAIRSMVENEALSNDKSYNMGYEDGVNYVADEIATALEGADSMFNRIKFLTDCGVK